MICWVTRCLIRIQTVWQSPYIFNETCKYHWLWIYLQSYDNGLVFKWNIIYRSNKVKTIIQDFAQYVFWIEKTRSVRYIFLITWQNFSFSNTHLIPSDDTYIDVHVVNMSLSRRSSSNSLPQTNRNALFIRKSYCRWDIFDQNVMLERNEIDLFMNNVCF